MGKIKYNLAKTLGHILRYFACAITIDKIDVSKSFFLSYFIISPIISWTLWKISRYTCKKVVYQKLDINESTAGSVGYTIAYLVYLSILFMFLIVLKKLGIIPFANDFDTRLINGIIQYFNNLIINFCNKIVEILQVTN